MGPTKFTFWCRFHRVLRFRNCSNTFGVHLPIPDHIWLIKLLKRVVMANGYKVILILFNKLIKPGDSVTIHAIIQYLKLAKDFFGGSLLEEVLPAEMKEYNKIILSLTSSQQHLFSVLLESLIGKENLHSLLKKISEEKERAERSKSASLETKNLSEKLSPKNLITLINLDSELS